MLTGKEALDRLCAGNERFVKGTPENRVPDKDRVEELMGEQHPFAIILGCSDSRVPAEIVFDQGIGDLFVIRVAGNIVAPSQIGSIEYAAEHFGVPLVLVLGHTCCGAVLSTLEELESPQETRSPNLKSIVGFIKPSVEPLLQTDLKNDRSALIDEAVLSNIRHSVQRLKEGSTILESLVKQKKLLIIGAKYSLATGKVKVLEA